MLLILRHNCGLFLVPGQVTRQAYPAHASLHESVAYGVPDYASQLPVLAAAPGGGLKVLTGVSRFFWSNAKYSTARRPRPPPWPASKARFLTPLPERVYPSQLYCQFDENNYSISIPLPVRVSIKCSEPAALHPSPR